MSNQKAEAIIDALAEAGYISDDLATSPDRFADMVAVVQPYVEHIEEQATNG